MAQRTAIESYFKFKPFPFFVKSVLVALMPAEMKLVDANLPLYHLDLGCKFILPYLFGLTNTLVSQRVHCR